jgi:hypothetical protein
MYIVSGLPQLFLLALIFTSPRPSFHHPASSKTATSMYHTLIGGAFRPNTKRISSPGARENHSNM